MRTLMVDDDPNIRDVVRRVLTRQFEALEIVECKDGLEALERLSEGEYDLVLLDVTMPLMDGLDVLQSIRRSPVVGKIPVIMMTGHNEEHTIRQALRFGVNDFILKPIHPTQLCERVLKQLTHSPAADDKKGQARQAFRPLALSATTPVLVADGSAEFRQFFRNAVSSLCTVHDVGSGLAAFQHCLEQPPYALFVGSELGIVSGEVLVRKLRALPRLCGVRIVGIETERTLLSVRKRGIYEVVILRSFVPDVFLEGVRSLLRKTVSASAEIAGVPDLKLLAISAAEESLSASLGQHVVLRPRSNRMMQPAAASVTLRVGPDKTPLLVHLAVPAAGIERLTARLVLEGFCSEGDSPDAALTGLVERLGQSIAAELQGRNLAVTCDSPVVPRQATRRASALDADQGPALEFDVPGEKLNLRVTLSVGQTSTGRTHRDASHARQEA